MSPSATPPPNPDQSFAAVGQAPSGSPDDSFAAAAKVSPFEAVTTKAMQAGVDQGGKIVADDEDAHTHAGNVATDYDAQLKQQFPNFTDEQRQGFVDMFKDELTDHLRGQLLNNYAGKHMQFLQSGVTPLRRSNLYDVVQKLPGSELGAIEQSREVISSAGKFKDGTAGEEDYQRLGEHLARSKYDSDRSGAQYAFDLASDMPKHIAEWIMLAGPAGKAGETAFAKVAEAGGGKFLASAAKYATAAAARTAMRLDKIAEQTLAKMTPELHQSAPDRYGVRPGDDVTTAVRKSALTEFFTNTAFEATGVFGPKTGFSAGSIAKSTGTALTGVQAAAAASHYLGGGGQGDTVTRYIAAKTPDEKMRVLRDSAIEAGTFLGLETMMHGAHAADAKGQAPTPDEVQDSLAASVKILTDKGMPLDQAQQTIAQNLDTLKAKGQAVATQPADVHEAMRDALTDNPTMTQDEAKSALAKHLTGPDAATTQTMIDQLHKIKPPTPAPQAGPPEPEPGTGLINPVKTGVPGVVSGAVEKTGPFEHLSPDEIQSLAKSLTGKPYRNAGNLADALKRHGMSDESIRNLSDASRAPGKTTVPPNAPKSLETSAEPPKVAEPTQERRGGTRPPQGVWDQISAEHPDWSNEQKGREAARRVEAMGIDNLTGYERGDVGTARVDATNRAISHVDQTGGPAVHAEIDLANLGGLNAKAGHEGANVHYRAMADIVKDELTKLGVDTQLFRHGGDEMSANVIGADQGKVEAALQAARARIADYAKTNGLDTIPHPKNKPEAPRAPGTGIHFGTTDIRSADSPKDIYSRADRVLETKKVQSDVNSKQTQAAQPVAPVPPAASSVAGPGEAGPTTGATEPAATTSPAAEPQSRPALADLQKKMASGMRITPEDVAGVLHESNLTAAEQHVLTERMIGGRSYQDVAGDPEVAKSDGTPYSRQRLKQMEQAALAKLGIPKGSIESIVHESDKADRALDMIEKGGRVPEYRVDPDIAAPKLNRRLKAARAAEQQLDNLTNQYIKEREDAGGKLSPEREQFFTDAVSRLSKATQIQSGGEEPEATAVRGKPQRVEPTPVRTDTSSTVQDAPANAPPSPPVEGPSGPPGGDAASSVAAPGGGAADSDQLSGYSPADRMAIEHIHRIGDLSPAEIAKQDARYPLPAPDTLARARAVHASGDQKAWEDMKAALDRNSPGERTDKWIKSLGNQKITTPRQPAALQGVNRQINADARTHYEDHQMNDERLQHDQQQAASEEVQEPGSTEAFREGVQNGLQAGETSPPDEAEGAGRPPGLAESADTGLSPDESFLFGESGGARLDVLGAKAAELRDRFVRFASRIRDGILKFQGISFPSTTRASRLAGEATARYDAVKNGGAVEMVAPAWIDKIMPDATPQENERWAATIIETRLRHGKMMFLQKSAEGSREAVAARQAASVATNPATKAAALKAADDGAQKAIEYMQRVREVQSKIGKPDEPLKTEADYQQTLADPRYKQMIDRYTKGGFVNEMEKNYRGAQGMDATDPIDSLTQIPGTPINLISKDKGIAGGRPKGDLGNLRISKFVFAKEASLGGDYKNDMAGMIENTLRRGMEAARKAEMYRTHVDEGQGVWGKGPIEGYKDIPFTSPPRGTQGAEPGDTFHATPESYDETRQVLGVDQPYNPIPFANELTSASLIAPAGEVSAHTSNLLTAMMRPGMWKGILKGDIFRNAYSVIAKTPAITDRLMALAQIGALKARGPEAGENALGAANPAHWSGKVLDTVSDIMRLTLEDSYDRLSTEKHWLTGEPLVPATETAKRDFINGAVGQYSKGAQPKFMVLMRDLGLSPFMTAGTKYYMGGLDVMTGRPGVESTSWKAYAALHGQQLAKVATVLSAVALSNYLMWNRWDGDDATPFGGIKTGQDKTGKTQYIDAANLIGLRRGMRATGVNAAIEGVRQGQPTPAVEGKAEDEMVSSLVHPLLGPPGQFAYTAVTGKNTIGQPVTESKTPTPWEKVQAALKTANPAVATVTGWDRPGEEVPTGQKIAKLFGPFGLKTRSDPAVSDFYDEFNRAQAAHQQFLQQRQKGLAVPDYGPNEMIRYRQLTAADQRMAELNKAMRMAKTDEDKARIRAIQVQVVKRALGR